jgi:predicted ribonuclease YlaK
MKEEKIIDILDTNILLLEPFVFLFFKNHHVAVFIPEKVFAGVTLLQKNEFLCCGCLSILRQVSVKKDSLVQLLQRNIILKLLIH